MALDLETLRSEIDAYLKEQKPALAVFYGYRRGDSLNYNFWDTEKHPDFREFLQTALVAGAKILVYHHQAFSLSQIDEALDQLEDSDLPRDEKRNYETRLRQLQPYEGFTCSVELSFAADGQVYVYELQTEWYQALNDILAELESLGFEEEDDEEDSLGGYFSRN